MNSLFMCLVTLLLYSIHANNNDTTSTVRTEAPSIKTAPITPTTATSKTTKTSLNCSSFEKCGDCVKDYHCFWCDPSSKCFEFPKGKIIPRGCKNNVWFLKQCVIPGYILIIVIPALAGLLLLCCGCCIYCKCCRSKPLHWKKQEERLTQKRKERQLKADEKKEDRKKKTDALRMKYGLLRDNDDEDPLI